MSKTITHDGTYYVSVIGPLTTTFTPGPSCFGEFTTFADQWSLVASQSCLPPGYKGSYDSPYGLGDLYYYSPGICPSGYTLASTMAPWLLSADETGYKCCPSDYHYQLVTYRLGSGAGESWAMMTCASTFTGSQSVYAKAIGVVWKSGDFANQAPLTTRPPLHNTESPAIDEAQTTGGDQTPLQTGQLLTQEQTPSSGLPRTAIAAIGAIVPVVFIALCALAFLCYRRRRTAGRQTASPAPELDSNIVYEMGSDMVKSPAPAPPLVELPTAAWTSTAPWTSTSAFDEPAAADVIDPVVPQTLPERLGGGNSGDGEIMRLRREQQKVGERLERLRKMQELDDEHQRLETQINDRLSESKSGS